MAQKNNKTPPLVDPLLPRPTPEGWEADVVARNEFRKACRRAAHLAAGKILLGWMDGHQFSFLGQYTGYDRNQGFVHVRTLWHLSPALRDRVLCGLITEFRQHFCSVHRTNFDGTALTLDHYWRIVPKDVLRTSRRQQERAVYLITVQTKDTQSIATRAPYELSLLGPYTEASDAKARSIGEKLFLGESTHAALRRQGFGFTHVRPEDLYVIVARKNRPPTKIEFAEKHEEP